MQHRVRQWGPRRLGLRTWSNVWRPGSGPVTRLSRVAKAFAPAVVALSVVLVGPGCSGSVRANCSAPRDAVFWGGTQWSELGEMAVKK